MARQGFTLVELMVTLLVMSIVAAGVTLSMGRPKRLAEMEDAVGAAVQFDLLTRRYALRHGQRCRLVFDLDADRITCRPARAGEQRPPRTLRLPAPFGLGRLVLGGKAITDGRTAVPCSDRGLTPSYAVRVDGPSGSRWLLFAGLTGRAVEMNDEDEVAETFSLLARGRDDAD